MNMSDYPSLSKTQPFGGKGNDDRSAGGSLIFTRGSLRRVSKRAFTVAAAFAGALYIFNAIDSLINGDDIKGSSSNNNNNKRNGRY